MVHVIKLLLGVNAFLNDGIVVSALNVSKKFSRHLRHVMAYGASDIVRNMVGLSSRSTVLRRGEFWAVDGVAFELKQGEALGLIGVNGSGKSTILKMLNGIYMPDKGRIEIKGRVGALIEVGAGFHPMLTGRENVYVNGTILGMRKKEIDRKFNDIVEFADIGDFIDAPVKHYSSGMFVRLGFAVAVHSDPDILLVDEVLAVGDAGFQKKCFDRILDIKRNGASIIFVSHQVSAVERLCTKALLIWNGKQLFLGNTREAVQRYFGQISVDNLAKTQEAKTIGVGEIGFSDVSVYEAGKKGSGPFIAFGKDIVIEFNYKFLGKHQDNNQLRVTIRTFEGRDVQKIILQEAPFIDGQVFINEKIVSLNQEGRIKIRLQSPRLFPQTYRLDIAAMPLDKSVHLGGISNAALFNIVPDFKDNPRYFEHGNMSVTEFDYEVTHL